MSKPYAFIIRDEIITDEAFIMSTWVQGFYHGSNSWVKLFDPEEFLYNYYKVIQEIKGRSGTVVKLAVLPDDKNVILGYVVFEKRNNDTILHWVYTKAAWRKMGIAKSITPKEVNKYTHLTKFGAGIVPPNWSFTLTD